MSEVESIHSFTLELGGWPNECINVLLTVARAGYRRRVALANHARNWRSGVLVFCSCLGTGACKKDEFAATPTSPISTASQSQTHEPTPNFEAQGPQRVPHDDLAWTRAVVGDPLDLAVLARREGAIELMRFARQGGLVGRTALGALVYAPDPEPALPQLCAWLRSAQVVDSIEVLTSAIHALLASSALAEETSGSQVAQECAPIFELVAHRPGLSTSARDRIASIQAMWGFRLGR